MLSHRQQSAICVHHCVLRATAMATAAAAKINRNNFSFRERQQFTSETKTKTNKSDAMEIRLIQSILDVFASESAKRNHRFYCPSDWSVGWLEGPFSKFAWIFFEFFIVFFSFIFFRNFAICFVICCDKSRPSFSQQHACFSPNA